MAGGPDGNAEPIEGVLIAAFAEEAGAVVVRVGRTRRMGWTEGQVVSPTLDGVLLISVPASELPRLVSDTLPAPWAEMQSKD